MRGRRASIVTALLLLLFGGPASAETSETPGTSETPSEVSLEERLWRHRNLGKAFYENPATQYQAVGEFEKALELAPDSVRERVNYGLALLRAGQTEEGIEQLEKAQEQDPSVPHTWFNLGIAYKRASRYDDALGQFEQMVELVPDEEISHYNLGVLYKLRGEAEKAVHHFERASELDPNLAGPHFQLATAYRQAKKTERAKRQMERFRELKKKQAGAAVAEDLEWSWFSEIYDTLDSMADPAPPSAPLFEERVSEARVGDGGGILEVLDLDADGRLEVAWGSAAGAGVVNAAGAARSAGLGELRGVHGLASGDLDNDGRSDLVVLSGRRALVLRSDGVRFAPWGGELPEGDYDVALLVDVDHDYDLDLLLFGKTPRLLRNDGDKGLAERTEDFPFVAGEARAAVAFDVVSDSQGVDVLVAYAGRGGVLYRDRLLGRYEAVDLRGVPPTTRRLLAADLDHDGWTDVVAAGDGVRVLVNSTRESFGPRPGVVGVEVAGVEEVSGAVALADFDHRGALDLVSPRGLHRHRGLRARGAVFDPPSAFPAGRAFVAADLDADGRVDLVRIDDEGRVVVSRNILESPRKGLRLALEGVKNLARSPGAEIEIKAGRHYQKRLYDGTPVVFGLGERDVVDTVRISWPNGLIQNETDVAAGQDRVFKEAPRLSGSCPMIFTWDGEGFRFITDILGVAPLGASAGDGHYFPVDSDETIQIPPGALVERDGYYEVRITEELREVAFLDHIRLEAVDRPRELSVFVNDKFISPPFPEPRLWGARERHHPVRATDHRGRDVLQALLERDEVYPTGFERDHAGVAEVHHLTLDFGPQVARDGEAILVLSGWVDWADGSTFRGASTSSEVGLLMPRLEMRGAAGEWVTVLPDMGIPAGKPKTIVVDLSGLWPSDRREVRIVTNLAVYWDEIFLGEDVAEPAVRRRELPRAAAELRFRGFSRPVIHPERLQPERFVYADRRDFTQWNQTPGLYTRYGDVAPLLGAADDRFVIMGSGDELRLLFAADLEPPPEGHVREFLLTVDGWAKDGDANTAFSQSVEPLPYLAMPQYPYEPPHHFPKDEVHEDWRRRYNTRYGLRLIRPLVEGFGQISEDHKTLSTSP